MGRIWDVVCTASDRLAEVREDVKALRRDLEAGNRSGCVDVEGLQKLIIRGRFDNWRKHWRLNHAFRR